MKNNKAARQGARLFCESLKTTKSEANSVNYI